MMIHSNAEDIELCSINRFDRTEPNFVQKDKKIRKISRMVRRDKIELVRLSLV